MPVHYDEYGWTPFTDKDKEALRRWIGREPRPVLAVAYRGDDGAPWVVVNDPLPKNNDGRFFPFPTLFWLAWPPVVQAIDRLESAGWIGRLRENIFDDDGDESTDRRRRLRNAHKETARLRLQLVDPQALNRVKQCAPDQYRVLAETGVAGMRHTDGVKCLHAHYADYLGRPRSVPAAVNPIGEMTAALLKDR